MTDTLHEINQRELGNDGLKELLNKFSNGLDETVNFGSHILKWDLDNATGSDEQLPIILSFRHFLELIDSVSILVRHSSIDPCKLILRSALETYFGLEYLFEKDTKNRCMAFMVWHVHKNLKAYEKLDPTSVQGKQLQRNLNKDKTIKGMDIPNIPELNPAIQNLESLLQSPEYKKAEQEYQRLKKVGEKNPPWYLLFNGPRNVQELAQRLKLSALYEIPYRDWSGMTHGTEIINGKLIGTPENTAEIVQIRYPKDAQSVTAYAVTLSLKTFSAYIDKRIPNKKQDYLDWYMKMKGFYLKVSSNEQLLNLI